LVISTVRFRFHLPPLKLAGSPRKWWRAIDQLGILFGRAEIRAEAFPTMKPGPVRPEILTTVCDCEIDSNAAA